MEDYESALQNLMEKEERYSQAIRDYQQKRSDIRKRIRDLKQEYNTKAMQPLASQLTKENIHLEADDIQAIFQMLATRHASKAEDKENPSKENPEASLAPQDSHPQAQPDSKQDLPEEHQEVPAASQPQQESHPNTEPNPAPQDHNSGFTIPPVFQR